MSLRNAYPRARLPDSHYFVSVARGDDMRTYALRPLLVWTLIALLPIAILWGAATTSYIAFHDDMIGAYLAHEAEMQAAYEDKLAQSRAELDRVASRQLLDQTSFEGKMHDLLTRQARLEQRGEIVAALASQASAGDARIADDLAPRAHPKAAESALGAIDSVSRQGPSDSVIAPAARAYAPSPSLEAAPAVKKPRPVEDSHASLAPATPPAPDRTSRDLAAAADNAALGAPARLGRIDYSLDRVERGQSAALAKIADRARDALGAGAPVGELARRAGSRDRHRALGMLELGEEDRGLIGVGHEGESACSAGDGHVEDPTLLLDVGGQPVGEDAVAGVVDDDLGPLEPLHPMDGGQGHPAGSAVGSEHLVQPGQESLRLGVQVPEGHQGAQVVGVGGAVASPVCAVELLERAGQPDLGADGLEDLG